MPPDQVTAKKTEQAARDCGAVRTAWITPQDIPVDPGFRTSCEMNQCGAYGCRWSCPPAIADVEVLHEDLLSCSAAMVFQADFPVGDIFDYEAMEEGAKAFYALCRCLEKRLDEISKDRFFVLGAGACRECRICTYPKAPCVRSRGPVLSLEAYGVDVTGLVKAARLPYNVSPELVTYTGLVLCRGD